MKKIVFAFVVVCLTSCISLHTGSMSSGPLLSATDRYVDIASGSTEVIYFLGLGGVLKDGLVYEAKKNMMYNRPLKKGEYYANVTVDFKKTNILILFSSNRVFIHADVLSTNKDSATKIIVTEDFKKIESNPYYLTYFKNRQDSFYVGEKIVYMNPDKFAYTFTPYEIFSFVNKDQAILKSFNSEDENLRINSHHLVYSMDKEKNGFKYGDSVMYQSQNSLSKKLVAGKVIATSKNNALVLQGKKTLEIKYEELSHKK